jgi:hypothetical protein
MRLNMDPTPNQEAGTQGTLSLGSNRRDIAAGVHLLQPLWISLRHSRLRPMAYLKARPRKIMKILGVCTKPALLCLSLLFLSTILKRLCHGSFYGCFDLYG